MTSRRPPAATVDAVFARANGRCEASPLTGCRARGDQIHHRQPRGMGGRKDPHTLPNLVLLCADCHRLVESRRMWARGVGLLVSTNGPAPTVPFTAHAVA